MIQLVLTDEEQDLLGQVLQTSLAALEVEILHTDNHEFKESLKRRREVLQKLAARLPELAPTAG